MILAAHKERNDKLNLLYIAKEFVFGWEVWIGMFGTCQWMCLTAQQLAVLSSQLSSSHWFTFRINLISMKHMQFKHCSPPWHDWATKHPPCCKRFRKQVVWGDMATCMSSSFSAFCLVVQLALQIWIWREGLNQVSGADSRPDFSVQVLERTLALLGLFNFHIMHTVCTAHCYIRTWNKSAARWVPQGRDNVSSQK